MTLIPEGRTELSLSGGGCSCCAVDAPNGRADAAASALGSVTETDAGARDDTPSRGPIARSFGVAGMTCGSCVRHVTEEISALEGVEAVDVALVAGGVSTVTVRSAAPLTDAAVARAVAEAGYDVVAR